MALPHREPYQLVAAARDEYLQRRQEANQYKLRAEKQLGLRPSTADEERYRLPSQGHRAERPVHLPTPQDRKQEGQQEYLRQLELIRQQYYNEMREKRKKDEVKPQQQVKADAYMVELPTDKVQPSQHQDKHRAPPVQDIEEALRQIRDDNREERRALQRRHKDNKGIMFEIRFDDGEDVKEQVEKDNEQEEKQRQGTDDKEPPVQEEEDPLNQTLSFQEGEELRHRDWSGNDQQGAVEGAAPRKAWGDGVPQTLLNALAERDLISAFSTMAESLQGEAPEAEEKCLQRKMWKIGPSESLLDALANVEFISTLDSLTLDPATEERKTDDDKVEKMEEVDSDVEVDSERLDPRSDDDDTNFEESEDELREEVAESMNNLFIMEDRGSTGEGDGGEEDIAEASGATEESAQDAEEHNDIHPGSQPLPDEMNTRATDSNLPESEPKGDGCESQSENTGRTQTEDSELVNKQ